MRTPRGDSPVMPWLYPRDVRELPTVQVNGKVAVKLPGETLRLSEQLQRPLFSTVARGVGSGAVIASPSANYPIVLPFGGYYERW